MTTVNSSNEFSSETEFSFYLKFSGQDNEDLMSGVSDQFTATQTRADPMLLSDDFVHQSSRDDRKTRKRKLDDEGFGTPATPGIPKTSMQYSMSDQGVFTESEQTHREDLNTEGPNSSSHEPMAKTYESAVDLFEDLAQGTEMMLTDMAQYFRVSEEYESAGLDEIESLLIQAKDQEETLSSLKEDLKKRLFMIGQRLST